MKMNTQTKPAPPKVVIAPVGCETYLTTGKEYQVTRHEYTGKQYLFEIIDDEGDFIVCLENRCLHLALDKWKGENNWIIKEREVSHD